MKVLLTGGTGGIGSAVAKFLISKGIDVICCDIRIPSQTIDGVEYFALDVTDFEKVMALSQTLINRGEQLDAIINVAGVFEIDSFIEMPYEKLKRLFDVNLMGAIYVNKAFHSLLKKDGRILITTSEVAPLDPLPFNGAYTVTKTALDAYAQALRQELNVIGQKVITIRPGAFNTELSRGSLEKTQELTQKTVLYKGQSVKFYKLVKFFMGTPSSPEKITQTYYKALTKKHPKIIYKKRSNKLLKLMNILPKRMQCAIIKMLLK